MRIVPILKTMCKTTMIVSLKDEPTAGNLLAKRRDSCIMLRKELHSLKRLITPENGLANATNLGRVQAERSRTIPSQPDANLSLPTTMESGKSIAGRRTMKDGRKPLHLMRQLRTREGGTRSTVHVKASPKKHFFPNAEREGSTMNCSKTFGCR